MFRSNAFTLQHNAKKYQLQALKHGERYFIFIGLISTYLIDAKLKY